MYAPRQRIWLKLSMICDYWWNQREELLLINNYRSHKHSISRNEPLMTSTNSNYCPQSKRISTMNCRHSTRHNKVCRLNQLHVDVMLHHRVFTAWWYEHAYNNEELLCIKQRNVAYKRTRIWQIFMRKYLLFYVCDGLVTFRIMPLPF